MSAEVDTSNDFMIGTDGQKLAAMLPVNIVTREQAYRTAAWIAEMAVTLPTESEEPPTFEQVREAIRST